MIQAKLKKAIIYSLEKFSPNLRGRTVLSEAATGNYAVTAVIGASAEANVFAIARDSKYGSAEAAASETLALAELMGVTDRITIVDDIATVNVSLVDIVTNTGFVRPIDSAMISRFSTGCVIPLMWEPWEYRKQDLDLEACRIRGIKVYGTNEEDPRLRTMEYIGYTVLYLILKNKRTPLSTNNILLLGSEKFVQAIERILRKNDFSCTTITNYDYPIKADNFDVLVVAEQQRPIQIIGGENSLIPIDEIRKDSLVVHISGNIDLSKALFSFVPAVPSTFGYMSYPTDFIDCQAIVDLHTAGFKVAEGMLAANRLGLDGADYKNYMEQNYPAIAFSSKEYW